jgi:hypothetical protein
MPKNNFFNLWAFSKKRQNSFARTYATPKAAFQKSAQFFWKS